MAEHLLHFGYPTIFLWVLVSQLGVPVPGVPLLLAAGALTATGRLAFVPTMAAAVLASLCADSTWFLVGRAHGRKVIGLLCRLSLEPASCVPRTEGAIARYGTRFLLVTKFLPGLGLLAVPVAGESRTPYFRFLAFDGTGALLWSSTYLLLGRFFGTLIEHNARLFQVSAQFAVPGLVVVVLGVVLGRLVRQRR